MLEEMKKKLAKIDETLKGTDSGGVEHSQLSVVRKELVKLIEIEEAGEPKKEVTLHVDTGPTCEGCQ